MKLSGWLALAKGGDRPYFFSTPPVEYARTKPEARFFEFELEIPSDVPAELLPPTIARPWTPPQEPPKS